MLVKQSRKQSAHREPIYFVGLESTSTGTVLVTNTASDSGQVGIDGFPVQYTQRINTETGACTCGCQGFQDSITRKARAAGEVPSILNGYTCKHIRKAAVAGEEWGYLEPMATPEPELVESAIPPVFDYVAFFESNN